MATPDQSDARTPLTHDELSQALAIDIYDKDGKTTPLGELTKGTRSVLIFTRHYWCVNCQAYVRAISQQIPPGSLSDNTQILIISNGTFQPIKSYATTTSSLYPIFTDPTCRLHAILGFKSALKEETSGTEKRDYMKDGGSVMYRAWSGFKAAVGDIGSVGYIGPKALNGGEVVISAGGECEYIYRMQNTVDHTGVGELKEIIGASGPKAETEIVSE